LCPSYLPSSRSTSCQASSRAASVRAASIWCRPPKDSRSKRTHSRADAIRSGADTVRI
jgi:hypothetical protein